MAWLRVHQGDPLSVSVFVLCELEAGAAGADDPELERTRIRGALEDVPQVIPDERFPFRYGVLLTTLHRRGRAIDTMDLLIATTAVVDGAALLTATAKHFDGVPDLRLLTYR